MDYVYTFGDPETLYLNVTNRCTNRCVFCVRNFTPTLGSGYLRAGSVEEEPGLEQLISAIEAEGDPDDFEEFVWCGYGEPTFRLDLITEAARYLRSTGARIRLNTNGMGCAIHGRDIMPELGRSVDVVSVSLNAPTAERYLELCAPDPTLCRGVTQPLEMWDELIDFVRRAPHSGAEAYVSVVAHTLDDEEQQACRRLVRSWGYQELRLR